MNIRMPRHMDEEILKVQDEFLKEDAREKGIVTLNQIPTVKEAYHSTVPFAEKSLSAGRISPDFRWELSSMQPTPRCWAVLCPATDVLTTRSIRLREWSFVQSAAAR